MKLHLQSFFLFKKNLERKTYETKLPTDTFREARNFGPQGFVQKLGAGRGGNHPTNPHPGHLDLIDPSLHDIGNCSMPSTSDFRLRLSVRHLVFLFFFGRFLVKDDGIDTPKKNNKPILSGAFNLTKQKLEKLEDFPHPGVLEANQFLEVILFSRELKNFQTCYHGLYACNDVFHRSVDL